MIEIIEIKNKPVTNKTVYYKYVVPIDTTPPDWFGHQIFAEEYRDFIVCRTDYEYLLWSIKTKDHEEPPIRLRGHFTTQEKAKATIDQFYDEEEASQTASELARDEKKKKE